MATPIGTNVLNSLSRRYIVPQVVDNVYASALMFFRMTRQNKKMLQGGLQIEVPLNYSRWSASGFYQGYEQLNITPSDTVKNAAFDWKQAYAAVSVDGGTLIRADSPEAVLNFLTFQFENAQTELVEQLANATWNDATTNAKSVDGLQGAIDDGGVAATYGGLARASNTWWVSTDDTTGTLSLAAMQTPFGAVTRGGRAPTLLVGTQANYNRFWALGTPSQAFPVEPAARDEQLYQAGFRNLLFNGVPFTVDSHVPANHIFFINEDYVHLYVNPRADFTMKEFREPVDQDAMTALILWAGNIVLSNCAAHAKLSNVTA